MTLFDSQPEEPRRYDTGDGSSGPLRVPPLRQTDTGDGSGGLPRYPQPISFGQVFWAVFLALCAYGLLSTIIKAIVHGGA